MRMTEYKFYYRGEKMNIPKPKSILILLLTLLFVIPCSAAQERFPGKTWTKAGKPEDLGYSSEKLETAKKFTETLKTSAVLIVVDGIILYEWGEVEKRFMSHSTRKSLLSALCGNYVKNGTIDLDITIEEFGIDDKPPLSDVEKKATVRDCIKARSGIYHMALYESARMKALKPERHSVRPGTHWYYNNWDFNVFCTIFEKSTGKKIFEAMTEEIAIPIGMEDFTAENGWYVNGEESIHPAYPFAITARDFARFGLLMLRKGNWNGKQVIPRGWVEESTRYHSDANLYGVDGYGYMWWVARDHNSFPHLPNVKLKEGTYSARGAGGHYVIIIPEHDMVFVHRVNTYLRGHQVSAADVGTLLQMIFDAKTISPVK